MDEEKRNSMMKSRSPTASSEFWMIASKWRSFASRCRSMPKGCPESAPTPRGIMFTRERTLSRRATSRFHCHA
eukprot:3636324-Rhodomonas_salina.1